MYDDAVLLRTIHCIIHLFLVHLFKKNPLNKNRGFVNGFSGKNF